MSHRELRNFTEIMRALGYPRLISLENFRVPNFPLVAEIALWLVKRYDPDVDIPLDIDVEQDRVMFIKSACHIIAIKAHVKLNARKLYMADGYAVKELLKVALILYKAVLTKCLHQNSEPDTEAASEAFTNSFSINSQLSDMKVTRQLASEITQRGAVLYDHLAKEPELKESRTGVLTRQLEINEVEKCVLDAIQAVKDETKKLHARMETVSADEANLEAKVEKKKLELERNRNRLLTLKSVRPAFMDEFERLEEELENMHQQYVLKFRCLAYLDAQLEELEQNERESAEERDQQIQRLVNRLQQEENVKHSIGEKQGNQSAAKKASTGSGLERDAAGKLVFGSMTGERGLDSDSDLDLEGEEDEEGSEDSSEEGLDIEDFGEIGGVRPPARRQPPVTVDSDNDF
ncbi:clusterin-associated protein 1-like [Ornithodoros turicata]|uniref:clusterin-associated protein 1-like n=1 Tax=Ornithodoros turicata TaxID=34597 RepID=UPI003138920F